MPAYSFVFKSLGLSPEDILHEMGYGEVKPEKEVLDILFSLWDEIKIWVRPACNFRIVEGEIKNSMIMLEDGTILNVGPVIANLLQGSSRFALFTATAGGFFQVYQENVGKKEDMLSVFILDTIGTCMVEKTGDKMERLLEKEIPGYLHTYRFSPGYCGWPLANQKELFRILGGNPCGISLSDVCLMSPIKSISGVMGIGKNVRERKYGCEICRLETCYKRKNRTKNL